ncbi:MAG: AraC family transcriptional regulator [Ruminococcaceae bacterium]|nr:AraC family transcriptional regulator [Oscillospiraceae bacterium]
MLRNTHDNIAMIADKCGYGSSSSFNRNFKEIVGCSPAEYRKGKLPNKS